MHQIDKKYQLVDKDIEPEDYKDIARFLKGYLPQTRYPYYTNHKEKLLDIWPQALAAIGNTKPVVLYRSMCAPVDNPTQLARLSKTARNANAGYYDSDKISYWAADLSVAQMAADIFLDTCMRLIVKTTIKPYTALNTVKIMPDREEYILPPGRFNIEIYSLTYN